MFTFRLEHNKQNKINKEKAFNRLDRVSMNIKDTMYYMTNLNVKTMYLLNKTKT